ncbi:MAG: TIM barrel protein [Cyclobacteriaceae bacterium]|nr:TIM barrel protein [Cyclobacteriaceae bacterium]
MKRRNFLRSGALVGGALAATTTGAFATEKKTAAKGTPFQLNYAPHFGMFANNAGKDLEDQVQFMSDQGFRSMEDNGMKGRSLEDQKRIARRMEKLDMVMGVFVAHKIYWDEPSLTSGDQEKRDEFLAAIKESVEVAKRVNAKWMTVVPGFVDLRQEMGYQTAHVVESLKQACDILEPHNLTMVLEPLNYMNHPGLFLTKSSQAYAVCKAVDSPSCKILYDIYHQQITEGNLIPNIDASWDEIAYFQIGDNPGRKEPTTGEINYKNVFKHIHGRGYKDVLGMEHGNFNKGADGEMAVIKAYRESDSF